MRRSRLPRGTKQLRRHKPLRSRPSKRARSNEPLATELQEQIQERVHVATSGCWIWTGAKNSKGYGQLWHDGKVRYVHRLAYEAFVGPIPSGLQLDHLCRTRACCNPEHLEPVTQTENLARGTPSPSARNAAKTHCPQGHEYTPENTYITKTKFGVGRRCKTCTLKQQKAKRARARRRAQRARPEEPLKTWCEARIENVCDGRAVHRHHVLPRSAGGSDDVSNTKDLCAACHRHVHGNPSWAYKAGLLARRTAVALALLAASAAVLTLGVVQIEAGSGCGSPLAAACRTGGMP